MTREDGFLLHFKAAVMARLLSHQRFPVEALTDRTFQTVVEPLLPVSVFDDLMESQEELEENYGGRHFRRRGRAGRPNRAARMLIRDMAIGCEATANKHNTRRNQSAVLVGKVKRMAEVFQLDEVEHKLLLFYTVCTVDEGFNDFLQDADLEGIRNNYPAFLAKLNNLPEKTVKTRIGYGARLRQSGLIETREVMNRGNMPPSLSDVVQKVLANEQVGPNNILEAISTREKKGSLEPEDFAHLEKEKKMLIRLLKSGWESGGGGVKGVNILLYGPPGLGKTEFARCIVQDTGAEAFAVQRTDDEGDVATTRSRRTSYDLFQRLCSGEKRPLLIVDEAEELLGEGNVLASLFGGNPFKEGGQLKAWLTHALEENSVPVCWIVNDISAIHPAVRRRFSHSVQFSELPKAVMERIWQKNLVDAGQKFMLPDKTIQELISSYEASPGQITLTVRSWKRITGRSKPKEKELKHILENNVQLCLGKSTKAGLRALDTHYDPSLVNLKGDMDAPRLERLVKRFWKVRGESAEAPQQLTLLFHGPSGAGKTEFAKYLAEQCGHKLEVKRMSDILSKWVGESEQNLAKAFQQAAENESILLLDEFDSLAFDRRNARASWEVSRTNELLQQIENFPGVLIASTNLADNLDQAISRRFSHKISFEGIDPKKRIHAVAQYFSSWLNGETFESELQERLVMLKTLHPGDLRAVRQKYLVEVMDGNTPSAQEIVDAIEKEARFRKGEVAKIGFGSGSPTIN